MAPAVQQCKTGSRESPLTMGWGCQIRPVPEATGNGLKTRAAGTHQNESGPLTAAIRENVNRKRLRHAVLNHLESSTPKRTRRKSGLPGDTASFLDRDEALALHSNPAGTIRRIPGGT